MNRFSGGLHFSVPEFQIQNSVSDFPDFHIPFLFLGATSLPYAFKPQNLNKGYEANKDRSFAFLPFFAVKLRNSAALTAESAKNTKRRPQDEVSELDLSGFSPKIVRWLLTPSFNFRFAAPGRSKKRFLLVAKKNPEYTLLNPAVGEWIAYRRCPTYEYDGKFTQRR